MCGIFGVISGQKIGNEVDIIRSGFFNKSRGPERTVTICLEDAVLMFHRLAINNLSHACDQPFIYVDGSQTHYVLCNGEIYNYKNLISKYCLEGIIETDCEVIFPLWKHFNYNFKHLNNALLGEYSFVIVTIDTRLGLSPEEQKIETIRMATDSSSVRPLFYVVDEEQNVIGFSSLLKGLTSLDFINKNKIKRIHSGEMIEIHMDNRKIGRHTQMIYSPDLNLRALTYPLENTESLRRMIVETLESCVLTRLQSDREVGCLLSGGLDSSLVAAIAANELKKYNVKLRTFSIGMKGGTDLEYARKVADHIESIHTEVIFTAEEGLSVWEEVIRTCETYDITTIRASVGQYLLGRWISENTDIKVVLNGDGADEAQMGYIYYYNAPNAIEAHKDSMRLIDNIYLYDGLRVDRNISRWGLEARVPYLDKRFVELYKVIHPNVKRPMKGERMEKSLIRESFMENREGILPEEVMMRRKEAFSDGVSSKEKSWYKVIQEYVKREKGMEEREWYKREFEREFGEEVRGIIPYYWMPQWVDGVDDPSARELKNY